MMHVKTKDTDMHIEGPDDQGRYWLRLSASGETCRMDLGRPRGMIETALLMAASVKFGRRDGDYTLAPHLQKIVDGAKTAPQWDTQADRLATPAEADAATLRAEVERLRGALEKINVGEGWAAKIAREALKEAGHEPT